jgi:hypothetical protein
VDSSLSQQASRTEKMNAAGARRRNKPVNAVVIGDEVGQKRFQRSRAHAQQRPRCVQRPLRACFTHTWDVSGDCCHHAQGVGKTSLITAAATESFPDFPPPVLPPTRLPAEATPEGVPMVIVDTSSREEEKTTLDVSTGLCMLFLGTLSDGQDHARTLEPPIAEKAVPLTVANCCHRPCTFIASECCT